jgi:hypothetical protein
MDGLQHFFLILKGAILIGHSFATLSLPPTETPLWKTPSCKIETNVLL